MYFCSLFFFFLINLKLNPYERSIMSALRDTNLKLSRRRVCEPIITLTIKLNIQGSPFGGTLNVAYYVLFQTLSKLLTTTEAIPTKNRSNMPKVVIP